jgi:ABC-type transport system substrate-binding protein
MPVAVGKTDQDDSFLDQGIYKTGQDIEKAKELAISSGLVNKEILLINNGASDSSVVAELIQNDLKQIGVKVKIWTLDTGSWLGVVFDATQWDMAVDFTLGNTVIQGYDMWSRMAAGGTYTKSDWVGSKEFFDLDAKALAEPDDAKRMPLLADMTKILAEGLIWYSLADMQQAVAYDKNIKNFAQLNSGSIVYSRLSW